MKFFVISLLLGACMICKTFQQASLELAQCHSPTKTYSHKAVLDIDGKVQLYWLFNEKYISFELYGQTTGWVGVGISPNGAMIGADIYVGWVVNGVANITDRHGTDSNTFPPQDPEKNVELLAGAECDGWTMIKFRRQIAACDSTYDLPITTDTLRVIWAFGASDPSENDIVVNDYHGSNRGVKSLLILEGSGIGNPPPNEMTMSFDLLNNDTAVPQQDTYYNCHLLQVPALTTKHHIVKIEPIIERGNEALVHHILLYQCRFDEPADPNNVGRNFECFGPNMPPDFQRGSCNFVVHGWAIGGGTFHFPNHVGYPIGTDDAPRYVVMETHYDNPNLLQNMTDNSGFRIHYTSQLRQHDAGILEVGHSVTPYAHIIPPNVNNFLSYGDCTNDCLDLGMRHISVSNINLFGTFLHSHLLGQRMTLRHVSSNGRELPNIARDNAYDFNYQESKIFTKEVQFRVGDSMQMVCNYKTQGVRSQVTHGGLGTTQEMCLAYVFYYPKLPVTRCESAPYQPNLYSYFGITAYTNYPVKLGPSTGSLNDITIIEPQAYNGQTIGDVLNSIEWNQTTGNAFSEFLKDVTRLHLCQSTGLASSLRPGRAISITQPYRPPPLTCSAPPLAATNAYLELLMVALGYLVFTF